MRREKGEREIWGTDWNVGAEAPTAFSRLRLGFKKRKAGNYSAGPGF
jgi:hypothetical protein